MNAAPTAVNDFLGTHAGMMASFSPLDNDSDPDGDWLTAAVLTGPAHGSVSTWDGHYFEYTPNSGFSGTDSFTYEVNDGNGGTATGMVSVSVTNAAPAAVNDTLEVHAGSGSGLEPLGNDSDPDGDWLTLVGVGSPAHGSVSAAGNAVSYSPDAGFVGTDVFTYTVSDGNGGTATGTVTVHVTNSAPTGSDTSLSVHAGSYGQVMVWGSDPDADMVTFGLPATGGQPAHGTVGYDGAGTFTYAATDPLFTGTDSFQYTVSDGYPGGTATYTVTVTVTNAAPSAADDYLTTHRDSVSVRVLDNDSDPDWEDSTNLSASLAEGPAYGTVSVGSDGYFTYSPGWGFFGTDSFTYTLSDGHGGTAVGRVDVTVWNTPATANSQAFTLFTEDQSGSGDVLMGTQTDADGDTLTVALKVAPPSSAGTFTLGTNGTFTFTPAADFFGTVEFKYTVDDGYGESTVITSTITVDPVNDAPSFTKGADQTVSENAGPQVVPGWATNLSVGPANESSQTLTFMVMADDPTLFSAGPAIDATGKLTYTPAANASGSTNVTVYATDSGGSDNGGTDMAPSHTFTITIDPACEAAPDYSIKYEGAKAGILFDQISKAPEQRKTDITNLFKKFGIDPSNADQAKKWANEGFVFGVVKDGNTITGGAAAGTRLSVDGFDKAPEKNKAYIMQGIETTIKLYDAAGKMIGTPQTSYVVEGFAVDDKGVARTLDLHLLGTQVGQTVNGKVVANVEITRDFNAFWGYHTTKAGPTAENPFVEFHSGAELPAEDSIKNLGGIKSYQVQYKLDSAGKWFWIDDSSSTRGEGVDNELSKE